MRMLTYAIASFVGGFAGGYIGYRLINSYLDRRMSQRMDYLAALEVKVREVEERLQRELEKEEPCASSS